MPELNPPQKPTRVAIAGFHTWRKVFERRTPSRLIQRNRTERSRRKSASTKTPYEQLGLNCVANIRHRSEFGATGEHSLSGSASSTIQMSRPSWLTKPHPRDIDVCSSDARRMRSARLSRAPVMTFTWKGYGDPRCGCRMRKPGRCRTMQRRARGTAPFRGAVKRQAAHFSLADAGKSAQFRPRSGPIWVEYTTSHRWRPTCHPIKKAQRSPNHRRTC
jgi:hypothetical protein